MRSLSNIKTEYYGRAPLEGTRRFNQAIFDLITSGGGVLMDTQRGNADFIYRSGTSYIKVLEDAPSPPLIDNTGFYRDTDFGVHNHLMYDGYVENLPLTRLTTFASNVIGSVSASSLAAVPRGVTGPVANFIRRQAIGDVWFCPGWLRSYETNRVPPALHPARCCRITFNGWDFEVMPFWYSCWIFMQYISSAVYSRDTTSLFWRLLEDQSRTSLDMDASMVTPASSIVTFSRTDSQLFIYIDMAALNTRGYSARTFTCTGVDEMIQLVMEGASSGELSVDERYRDDALISLRQCVDTTNIVAKQQMYFATLRDYCS